MNIVTISDDAIASQSGHDLTEQIRNFLRENYQTWGIKYVLIIGDMYTIPMRYCYYDPNNHDNNPDNIYRGDVPTDFYYADLSLSYSESWDLDGDGYYGEYGDDSPDFEAEIFVGRIPTNCPEYVKYTLEKIVSYEQSTGEWKNNALHAGAIIRFTNETSAGQIFHDGATLLNKIEQDFMIDWKISHYSEQVGVEKSLFQWNKLTEESLTSEWKNGQYGLVNWMAHGNPSKTGRLIWLWDNGDDIPQAHEKIFVDMISIDSCLDDDYPSIVFAASCLVGYPESDKSGNLAIDLLTKPGFGSAVSIVCSTRIAHGGYDDWPREPGGLRSLCYEFNHYLLDGPNGTETVGEALYHSKYFCNSNYGWDYSLEYQNMYDLNLYGDPSLRREGVFVEGKPLKPTIQGETSGKTGDVVMFTAQSTDNEGDQIFYLFDWGDNSKNEWLGPFESYEEIEASHVWKEKGIYEVKVKARDIHGLESDWSDPLVVSMPKNKLFINPVFLQFLENHPHMFPILRQLQEL